MFDQGTQTQFNVPPQELWTHSVPFWPSAQASHSSEQCPLLVIHLWVLCSSGLLYTMNHFYEEVRKRRHETPQQLFTSVHCPLLRVVHSVALYLWHMDGNLMESQMRKPPDFPHPSHGRSFCMWIKSELSTNWLFTGLEKSPNGLDIKSPSDI